MVALPCGKVSDSHTCSQCTHTPDTGVTVYSEADIRHSLSSQSTILLTHTLSFVLHALVRTYMVGNSSGALVYLLMLNSSSTVVSSGTSDDDNRHRLVVRSFQFLSFLRAFFDGMNTCPVPTYVWPPSYSSC